MGRKLSDLSPGEQRRVRQNHAKAEAASRWRQVAARKFGEESEQARTAWTAEQRAWEHALPRGGYVKGVHY